MPVSDVRGQFPSGPELGTALGAPVKLVGLDVLVAVPGPHMRGELGPAVDHSTQIGQVSEVFRLGCPPDTEQLRLADLPPRSSTGPMQPAATNPLQGSRARGW